MDDEPLAPDPTQGFLPLWREFLDPEHPLRAGWPMDTPWSCYIDLYGLAVYRETVRVDRRRGITIRQAAGQVLVGLSYLARRWHVTEKRVRTILARLERMGFLVRGEVTQSGTLFDVVGYGFPPSAGTPTGRVGNTRVSARNPDSDAPLGVAQSESEKMGTEGGTQDGTRLDSAVQRLGAPKGTRVGTEGGRLGAPSGQARGTLGAGEEESINKAEEGIKKAEEEEGDATRQRVLALLPPEHHGAFEGYRRVARFEPAFLAELLRLHAPITGGQAFDGATIGRALSMMAANGETFNAMRLAGYCRRLVEGPPPSRRSLADDEEDDYTRAAREVREEREAREARAGHHRHPAVPLPEGR